LAANLRQAEGQRTSSEELGEQLAKNWKNVVLGVLLVLAISVGVKWMREGQENARGGASQKFEGAQRDFTTLFFEPTDGTDLSHIERAFEDKLRAIGDVGTRSTYAQLAEIYRGAAEFRRGEIAKARERFKPFTVEMLGKSPKLSKEAFLTELALLVKAKTLCSEDSTKSEGQELLRKLALDSNVIAGEALLAYNRIFGLDQGLVDQALQKHPALREILKAELSAQGAAV